MFRIFIRHSLIYTLGRDTDELIYEMRPNSSEPDQHFELITQTARKASREIVNNNMRKYEYAVSLSGVPPPLIVYHSLLFLATD